MNPELPARLDGRAAVVTGGAGHLGEIIAANLLGLGAKVLITDRKEQGERDSVKRLGELGGDKLHWHGADLLDEAETRSIVRTAFERFGPLHVLVHNAGYISSKGGKGYAVKLEDQEVQAWDEAMKVNLTSAFVLVQEAARAQALAENSSVVFIGSIHGHVGPDHRLYEGTDMGSPAAYGASKAGLEQLARYLSTTLAPRTRVNVISPGGILRGQPEEFVKRYEARTPAGRMATEKDMAGALVYLATDMSRYVTGQNIVVDGGYTTW
jgi:NAD(P)-dependent dehydrogenase (short-subunit alcohol dehydrogenase family)